MEAPKHLRIPRMEKKKETKDLSTNQEEEEEKEAKVTGNEECTHELNQELAKSTLNPNAQEWYPFAFEVERSQREYIITSDIPPKEDEETKYLIIGREEEEEKEVKTIGTKEGASELTLQAIEAALNPNAKEWYPTVSDEQRPAFMTFSRGFPLTKDEIMDYFTRIYGDIVEDIQIYYPRNREPEFGKIVFKYSYVSPAILHHKESIKLYMAGKSLWLKKYKPS